MKSPDSLSPVEAARKILEARNNEQSSELVEGVDETSKPLKLKSKNQLKKLILKTLKKKMKWTRPI